MKAPLISIITVVYNASGSIARTIESTLSQSCNNFEYIIIDGNSNDGTQDIIKHYEGKITTWISEPDQGIYDAMNKGLQLCKGEWVYFLNSNDLFIDELVLARIESVLLEASSSVVVGRVQTVNPDLGFYPKKTRQDVSIRSLFESHFCHQALFVKREAYLAVGSFQKNYSTFADFFSIAQVIKKEGGTTNTDIVIALFDLSGVSSGYKKAMKLYKEKEEILLRLGEGKNSLFFLIGYLRSFAYYLKESVLNKL